MHRFNDIRLVVRPYLADAIILVPVHCIQPIAFERKFWDLIAQTMPHAAVLEARCGSTVRKAQLKKFQKELEDIVYGGIRINDEPLPLEDETLLMHISGFIGACDGFTIHRGVSARRILLTGEDFDGNPVLAGEAQHDSTPAAPGGRTW